MARPDKLIIESYLNRFLQVTQQIDNKILETENQLLKDIKEKSTYSSYAIGTVGAIAILYLLSNTPYTSQLNKTVSETIDKIVFSKPLQAAGLSKRAGWWSWLGYKDEVNSTVKMISETLQFLNKKFISPTGISGLFFSQATSNKTQRHFYNYFKNHFTSNCQFITHFNEMDFDSQNEIANLFVLNHLKKKLSNTFDPSFKNCKLSDIKLIRDVLKNLQTSLIQELRFIHNSELDENKIFENYQLFSRIAELTTDYKIPNEYICPLTLCIMVDPVKLGVHTFEREAIEKWINAKGTHPLTRESVTVLDLVSNTDIKNLIQAFEQPQKQLLDSLQNFQFLTELNHQQSDQNDPPGLLELHL